VVICRKSFRFNGAGLYGYEEVLKERLSYEKENSSGRNFCHLKEDKSIDRVAALHLDKIRKIGNG
jgi:hypothetical protein